MDTDLTTQTFTKEQADHILTSILGVRQLTAYDILARTEATGKPHSVRGVIVQVHPKADSLNGVRWHINGF